MGIKEAKKIIIYKLFQTKTCSGIYFADTYFSPAIELIKVTIKNNRQKLTGSLKKTMPKTTVPTAPIPVQTA